MVPGVDGVDVVAPLFLRRCFRMDMHGRSVRIACAMSGTGQRSPDGEQHGEEYQQQDSDGVHGQAARDGWANC